MADSFSYSGMHPSGQAGGYHQFHYPGAGGDQNAQLLQGYALQQQGGHNGMFGNQSGPSYNFDQSNSGYGHSSSVPVCQVGPGSQVQMQAGFNPMAFIQDPNGTSRGGPRGSQRGGFNKLGADGLREDTVFVSNLPQTVDHETMKAQFGVVGKVKMNNKSGMPMIWIFKEKGIPKGDALVTYEDPQCVQAAIKYFSEHEFFGTTIEVKQAVNSQRPVIIPPGGGGAGGGGHGMGMQNNHNQPMDGHYMAPNGSSNPAAAFAAAAVAAAASGNTMASLMNNSAAAAASLAAFAGNGQYDSKDYSGYRGGSRGGGRGGMPNGNGIGRVGGSNQAGSREGDWSCSMCGNMNFSWREECNRCHVSRAQDGMGPGDMPSMSRGGMGGGGMHRGGMGPIPVVNAQPGFGRGGGMMGGGGGMPMPGRGRGGGPMRGSGVGVGRARPAPY